jgi:protein SCO1/2
VIAIARSLLVLCALCTLGATAGAASGATPRLDVGIDEHLGARVPTALPFTDSTGTLRTLGSLMDRRHPVVLVMAYARCTMLCSVVLHGIAAWVAREPSAAGRDYIPIVVSLDPSETPDEGARRQNKLLADIGRPGDRAAWPYLVGDQASVSTLARALGFRYAWDPHTQQYAHPAVVFVLSPDGRIAEYVRGVTFDGLGPAIERADRGAITSSSAQDLLACFHFDSALSRYGRNITLFLRLGAAVVLAMLAALVTVLIGWERRRHA